MNNLYICGVDEVPLFADKQINYIFSIGGKEEKLPYIQMFSDLEALYRFKFHDLSENYSSYQKHIDNGFIAVEKTDIDRMISLFRDIPKSSNVLVHCFAGISRSTAAAFILGYYFRKYKMRAKNLSSARIYSWESVFQQRPNAHPNVRMIKFADSLMNEHGVLLNFALQKLNITNYAY